MVGLGAGVTRTGRFSIGAQRACVVKATTLLGRTSKFETTEFSTLDEAGIGHCDTFFGTRGSVHNTNHSVNTQIREIFVVSNKR